MNNWLNKSNLPINLGENAPFWAKITKIPHLLEQTPLFGRKIRKYLISGQNSENTPFWAAMPLFWRKYRKYPISAKMPLFGRKFRKYPILGKNAPLRAKIPNIPHFGQKFRKYLILGEKPEIPHFFAKMLFFGRKIRKYPFIGENIHPWEKISKIPPLDEDTTILVENGPFWAKISKILHFGRKCPFWGGNLENTPFYHFHYHLIILHLLLFILH